MKSGPPSDDDDWESEKLLILSLVLVSLVFILLSIHSCGSP